jgi:hypothetical protein
MAPHAVGGQCPHQHCGGTITDVWTEFMETPAEKAAAAMGKADFTCPHCSQPVRFDFRTQAILPPHGGEVLHYHYGSAVKRAAYENTSILGLMRDKAMVLAGKPAFFGYAFKDRSLTPLTEDEGEEIHEDINP